jgi:hypothetical protein
MKSFCRTFDIEELTGLLTSANFRLFTLYSPNIIAVTQKGA